MFSRCLFAEVGAEANKTVTLKVHQSDSNNYGGSANGSYQCNSGSTWNLYAAGVAKAAGTVKITNFTAQPFGVIKNVTTGSRKSHVV